MDKQLRLLKHLLSNLKTPIIHWGPKERLVKRQRLSRRIVSIHAATLEYSSCDTQNHSIKPPRHKGTSISRPLEAFWTDFAHKYSLYNISGGKLSLVNFNLTSRRDLKSTLVRLTSTENLTRHSSDRTDFYEQPGRTDFYGKPFFDAAPTGLTLTKIRPFFDAALTGLTFTELGLAIGLKSTPQT